MNSIWIVAALIVAGAGWLARKRIARSRQVHLDDDAIRAIEQGGPVKLDEPLDEDAIRAAEDAFWAESYHPEEFDPEG